jgi:hypothetical protein
MVTTHWKTHFPKEAKALERAGLLESAAEDAARRAGNVISQSLAKGMQYFQTHELATEEWGMPPTIDPRTKSRTSRPERDK